MSFPGPLPPLKIEDLNKGAVRVRTYRNRRIGDFLKELHLTEGRCTGVPKIHNAMVVNGSPSPKFETDENQSFFLVTLPIHPEASRRISSKEKSISNEEKDGQSEYKTHQLEPKTHQPDEFLGVEKLPDVLKSKTEKLNKRSKNEEVRSVFQPLSFYTSSIDSESCCIVSPKSEGPKSFFSLSPFAFRTRN